MFIVIVHFVKISTFLTPSPRGTWVFHLCQTLKGTFEAPKVERKLLMIRLLQFQVVATKKMQEKDQHLIARELVSLPSFRMVRIQGFGLKYARCVGLSTVLF